MDNDARNVVNGTSVMVQDGFTSSDMGISVNFTPPNKQMGTSVWSVFEVE